MRQKNLQAVLKILICVLAVVFSLAWAVAAVLAAGDNVSLSGLSISGPGTVNSGSSASYTATANFGDGTTKIVTDSTHWSLKSGSSYAKISSRGVLTGSAQRKNRKLIVAARYQYQNTTQSAQMTVTLIPGKGVSLNSVMVTGPASVASNSTASYTATATFNNGTTQDVTGAAKWSDNSTYAQMSSGGVMSTTAPAVDQAVTVSASYTYGGISKTGRESVIVAAGTVSTTSKSINSTSQNGATPPPAPVAEQAFKSQSGFNIFAVNDLGMHCGDLDHRVASILPPFNVLHGLIIQKGTSSTVPEILTSNDIDMVYSAASNPNDPALSNPTSTPVYKTNFWDQNPASPGTIIAFDAYNPFYPPGILSAFTLAGDIGLPAPDLALLYPISGTGVLAAGQQKMPGVTAPYSANVPQSFGRFDTDFPFFVNFPFGYRQNPMNWFAADGIPMAPFDDLGRSNSFPLMRVQAITKNTTLTGTAGAVIASVDTVVPVSAEANCYTCHCSKADGGNAVAACIPGTDANCTQQGSPHSGTAFAVATASMDTSTYPAAVKREWAADNNIIRLHDVKFGTDLQASTPVVCQRCHYSPALDLAHVGPVGPPDANANGRDQKIHHTNSRALHVFHGQFSSLFVSMPLPTDPLRTDPATGLPTLNTYAQNQLIQSCYLCHPGKNTQCLRGIMATTGGLVCQDCHGNMSQVGNDFSVNFSSTTPYPQGADLTRRVPWAAEPRCQSCHTGDATDNLGLTDPNVIKSSDGIRLLQAYRTNDMNATPIAAANKRFAEETNSNGNMVLHRLSKGHSGIFCEACHGSTHAEWPVQPESGASIANDNMSATQIQGHTGKIIECTACHTAGTLPVSLGGPHGMHPVNDQNFASNHDDFVESNRAQCQACHGKSGQGTVLSKVAATRSLAGRTLAQGYLVSCGTCHSNPL